MKDLYFQPKFAEAIRLGGFRLELHYHSGCAENEYEIRLIDLFDPALPSLRIRTSRCRRLVNGLRYLEAKADANNGIGNAARVAERLRPLLINDDAPGDPTELNALMKRLDRDCQRHNARIDAEWERVDCLNRQRRLERMEASS